MDRRSFNRRRMLTYLGIGTVSMTMLIACTNKKSNVKNETSLRSPDNSENRSMNSAGPSAQSAQAAQPQRSLPEFQGIEQWINSSPLSINDLKGNVTLVQIWTFACINCQRTLPYMVRWHEQYAQQGLKVIGVHTPEFGYEREIGNVKRAIAQRNITYPVAIDNGFKTWKAYNNEYWPHLFLADRQGIIRYDHIGEGQYDITEKTIQTLLSS